MTNKYHQRLGWLCLTVVIVETLLVILSWLLSAMRGTLVTFLRGHQMVLQLVQ